MLEPRIGCVPGVSVCPVRTPTLPPATHTNSWVLGRRGATVIDPASPWPDEQQRLLEFLDDFQVERILLTHHHPDHVGGAEVLRQSLGVPIVAHPQTASRVDFTVDETLLGGEELLIDGVGWRTHHTPGHAPGHLCLFQPESQVVVAGDMVAGIGTIVLEPAEGNLAHYLTSLAELRDLAPKLLLPAHGPIIENAIDYLQAYIDHRNMRTRQVIAALGLSPGPARPIELVPEIYPDLPEPIHGLAALQVQCHLLWLETQGRVKRHAHHFQLVETNS